MTPQPLQIILTTPAAGSTPRIPELFWGKLAAAFPSAKITEFYGELDSFSSWYSGKNISKAAQVIVQPLCVVAGEEYEKLLHIAKTGYPSVRVGLPLLSLAAGVEKLAAGFYKEQESVLSADEAVVFVGHGSRDENAEKMYDKLGQALSRLHPSLFAFSLKSDFEALVSRLGRTRNVLLVPLLVQTGGNTWRKISGEGGGTLCSRLEHSGFSCTACNTGLLENPVAQDVWIDNIQFVISKM